MKKEEPYDGQLSRTVLSGGGELRIMGTFLSPRRARWKEPPIQPHSVARNPSLAKQLFGYAILGFALTEAIALSASMMAFLILFVFQFFGAGIFWEKKYILAAPYWLCEQGCAQKI